MASLFFVPVPNPQATMRLVCFPYAGGSSTSFMAWAGRLLPGVELVLCQLPGRVPRLFEPPYEDMSSLVRDLTSDIQPLIAKPLAFFGHSMGCKVAYQLMVSMHQQGLPLPVQLIVSAASAPFYPRRQSPIHNLPDKQLIAAIAKMNGTPKEVLEDEELMGLYIPSIRADFKIIETYINESRQPLPTCLAIMGGVMDDSVLPSELTDWSQVFQETRATRWFQGGHFYINHQVDACVDYINQLLAPHFSELNELTSV